MSSFICEKCGCIDNTACDNNYWIVIGNRDAKKRGVKPFITLAKEFEYYNEHICCSDCCKGVAFDDHSGVISKGWHNYFEKEHWSKLGKDKILVLEAKDQGDFVNATEYFESIGEL